MVKNNYFQQCRRLFSLAIALNYSSTSTISDTMQSKYEDGMFQFQGLLVTWSYPCYSFCHEIISPMNSWICPVACLREFGVMVYSDRCKFFEFKIEM